MSILNVLADASYDNQIINKEFHSHQPYISTAFDSNDEIRIPIQQQDIYTLPSESLLYIEGKILKQDGTVVKDTKFINNGIAFLFDEIRYELNGVEVDKNKNVGVTSTIKGYLSFNKLKVNELENAAWGMDNTSVTDTKGLFNACIPLNILLGFAEDFKTIIVNAKQELILIRSKDDKTALKVDGTEVPKITLTKIQWKIPYVTVNDSERLKLLKIVENGQWLTIAFRSWALYEYPILPIAARQTWAIKTSTQLEKLRYVVLAFQTDKKNSLTADNSHFDNCKLTNVKLYINGAEYPYENLNIDFDENRFAILYKMYSNFQQSYYGKANEPYLSKVQLKNTATLMYIDCSKQNDALKTGAVDVKLEFEAKVNFPDKTAAYCLIINDRILEYSPLNSTVKRLV